MAYGLGLLASLSGILISLHAAYSAAQHREYLRITEQDYTRLPLDVYMQTLFALFLVCFGIMKWRLVNLKVIRANADTEYKTWETFGNLSNFYVFNHRGRALFRTTKVQEK